MNSELSFGRVTCYSVVLGIFKVHGLGSRVREPFKISTSEYVMYNTTVELPNR